MKRLMMVVAVLALFVTACGPADDVGDGGPVTTTTPGTETTTTTRPDSSGTTTTTTPPATRFVDVYFVQSGEYAASIERAIPDTPMVATSAMKALLEGPTSDEKEAGLSTAIPTDTLFLGLTIEDGLATVDLSREFESGGGSFAMISRLAQVVYTLTQFSTVDAVNFELDGQPVTVFSNEGLLLENPVTAADYVSALPFTASLEEWDQGDLPDISATAPAMLRNVVLVAEDDVLNVRIEAGVSYEVIGGLAPGVTVALTGEDTQVGSSTWVEIETPVGPGWVNSFFLGSFSFPSDVPIPDDVKALLDEMAQVIEDDGDLSTVASSRGLFVSHHTDPIRFPASELDDILSDPTTYKWGSNALDVNNPDDAKEIPARTFAEAVAASWLSTYDDPDRVATVDEPIEGGNGRTAAYAIPVEFQGFHYVGLYDSGDNPDYGGLDWTIWYVSIDFENGEPKVVGLTIDQWAP